MTSRPTPSATPPPGSVFKPNEAAPARTYAELRGAGKEAFASDREAASELRTAIDQVDQVMQENAAALVRVVAHLALEGYEQFADLGCGKPLVGGDIRKLPDLADVAGGIQPGRLWFAMDCDELVATACRALLRGPGVKFVQGDLRHTAAVLDAMAAHLDLAKPVAVMLGAVIHYLDDHEAEQLMTALREHLVPASAVLVTSVTRTGHDPDMVARGKTAYERKHGVTIYIRTADEIAGLVDGFDIEEPGLVPKIDFLPGEQGSLPVREAPHFLMVLAKRPV
ncbi:SAM-dependent methyltransferase [Nonomuraea ceibae]|uniref:SAM-dependent methyltransferase n=1 Tax=Nonomuraea ceibae TaxID=1935170 RepID=UPI001C5D40F1|nr:SAM-dependent methyltransferase [Nonomuraea ceibae]